MFAGVGGWAFAGLAGMGGPRGVWVGLANSGCPWPSGARYGHGVPSCR